MCYVTRAVNEREPKIPSYDGGKFPLSTFLAERVRQMMSDPEPWSGLPASSRWIAMQRDARSCPSPTRCWSRRFRADSGIISSAYPFEGRLAHQTLGMLLTRRLERMRKRPLGFLASEYALAVWGLEPMGDVDIGRLFDEDMLGDDLESWLAESALMKRTFRDCAIIAGMIEKRSPGAEKTGRQITFSTDLIYDVLRKHQPDHILLQAAFQDAGEGLLDIRRLGESCAARTGGSPTSICRACRRSPCR